MSPRRSSPSRASRRLKKQASRGRSRVGGVFSRLSVLRQEQLEERRLLSVNLLGSFAGMTIDSNTGGTLFTPPDACGAASPGTTYVETVNQQVTIYNKTTGAATATDNLSHFLITTGGLPRADAVSSSFDPSITYDDQIGRFIVGDMDYDFGPGHVSRFDFAVSKSSDPATLTAADWNFYQLDPSENDGTASGTFDADFPGNLGWNHDAFIVTLNMFAVDGSTAHVQVDSVSSADLLAGVSQANLHVYRNDDSDALSLRPAVMHDSKAGDPMWFVDQAGKNAIQVFKMTNVLSNSASFVTTQLPVNPYNDIHASGVYPRQPDGTTVTTNQDSRIQKVAEANNLLVASQAVNVSPTENDARWYEIDVSSGTPVIKGQGNVSGGDNTYLAYPAIDINASGDIGMTYMQSGTDAPTDFLSMWVTGRAPTDAAGTMQTPVLAQAGAANYSDSNSNGPQAGDFSGISADADGSFFAASEFATNRNGNNWGTQVAHFSLSTTSAPPSVVYVNGAWSAFSKGQAITDADPVTPGSQAAIFGTTAFATVDAALAAVAPGGTVYVNSGDYSTESVSLANNDTLALLGTGAAAPGTVTFGSLAGAAGTTVDTGSVGGLVNNLREGTLDTSTNYAGQLSGPGSLTIVGGSLTLSGSGNTYAGGTNVNSGTLLADGTAGSGAVIVGSGSTLGGTGTIAGRLTVSAGGTVSPGDPTSGPGILTTGPLTLLGTYTAQIDGATAGANFDQLDASGAATLTGGGLTLTLGYAPSLGDRIVLVSGGATVVGPVSVNGSVVNEGGHVLLSFGGLNYDFKASYAGDKLTLTLDENPTINVDSYAGGASHTIDVSMSGGNTLVKVDGNTVFNEPTAVLTGLTLDAANANDTFNIHSVGVVTTINGGTGSDTFTVTGPLAADLTIVGGQPATGPGDLLQFDAGAKPVTISATTLTQTGSGTLTYSGIANLHITNDAGVTLQGTDNTANAVTLSRDLAANTLNDITLNGGATIAVSTASSLDYVGGGGTASNQLTIDENANGLPMFTGTAAGMHTNLAFAGSNPATANIGVNISGGGSGANSLVINFIHSHDVADYSDNAASTGSGVTLVASGLNISYGSLATLIFNGSGGTLTLSDAANPTVTSLTVSDPTPGSGQTAVSGNGAWAAVALAGFNSLSVQGNNANDNTIVLSGADAATVGGQALANVTLEGGSGNDTISVESLSAGITATLLGGDGANAFKLQSAGGSNDLTNIAGSVNISPVGDSTSAIDTLSIDDSDDQSQRTITITQTTMAGITGSGAASVAYDGSGRIQAVHIAGGNSGNEFDIQGTNPSVAQGYTINTGAGADTVNISRDAPTNRGTLAEIQAPIFLNTQGGGDSLNVSDLGSAGATYSIVAGATPGSTTLSTAGSANITYDANGTAGQLAHFNLTGGDGGNDQFNVNLSSLGEATALRIAANSAAGGNTVALTADSGVADSLTVRPNAADAGLVSDTQFAGGTALASVAYSGINAIQLIGQTADGDTAQVVAKTGDDLTYDLAAQTVAEAGFAGISLTGFGAVNLDAVGAAVDLVDKATGDSLTVTATGPTSGTAQATTSGQTVNFNAARLNVDLPNGNRVIVKTSSAASTLVADEPDRTIWATASDGAKLIPIVLSPDVTTVELDGGTGKTTFVVTPAPGLLASGTSDVVGSANFQVPDNLLVEIVGGGAAADSKLVVANYDPASGNLTSLGSGQFAVDDRASATSGALHLYHANGASGPNQYPDVGYTGVGAVDVETQTLTGHLSTEAAANWITQLYVQLLGREPGINEVTFWMHGVQSGLSVQQVAAGFVGSHEYRAEQINLLYEKYLGRKADAVGLAYSIGLWNAAGGPDQVLQVILGSPEFYARTGQLQPGLSPDAAWVTALYQDLLGRDPEPQATAAWVNYLQAHGKPSVVLVFVASDEYRSDAINNLFQTYLGRSLDSVAAPAFLQAMRQGLTQDQLLTIIVSSDEYINKAT